MFTKQETFDIVAKHLLTQAKKAESAPGKCKYRAPNGLKCAAGILIPDDKYDPQMDDGSGMVAFRVVDEFPDCGLQLHDIGLVTTLQQAHDQNPLDEWRARLEHVADMNNLTWKFADYNKEVLP